MGKQKYGFKKKDLINDLILINKTEFPLSREGRRALLEYISWVYSERTDITQMDEEYDFENEEQNKKTKIIGNKYWSKSAINKYEKTKESKEFIFEHIVPKKIFIDYILDNPTFFNGMRYQEIKKLLDKILVGCVITKEEDQKLKANGLKQKMPKDRTDILEIAKNPWARYKECEIEVFEIKWENKEIQQKNSLSF